MIIGIHHGGITVADLESGIRHLMALTGWTQVHRLDAWHPLVAGTGTGGGAMLVGPNAHLEVLQAPDSPPPTRRSVAEAGITHLSVQLPDMAGKNEELQSLGIERHADPVELGTGFSYLYVRDGEHNVVEIEGAAHAPRGLTTWFSHVGIATNDVDRLRAAYERLFGNSAVATARLGGSAALDLVTALEGADVTMTWVPAANANVELIQFHNPMTGPPERRPAATPGVGHLCVEVEDVSTALGAALDSGFDLVHEPTLAKHASVARAVDPDGNLLEFVSFNREDDPLSLRTIESFDRYRQMDALLAERANR